MADSSKIQEFPDINNKLAAPTKKSLFERQKAEAEAKRIREEAETAAVYQDFLKSFEDEDATSRGVPGSRDRFGGSEPSGLTGGSSLGGPPRRHFAGAPSAPAGRGGIRSLKSGGTTSGPGSLGPPPGSVSRKRAYDGTHPAPGDGNHSLFAFEDAAPGVSDAKAAFREGEDEDEVDHDGRKSDRTAPKPTLHLSLLPPGTSPSVIKSYLPLNISVDTVRILPPLGPASTERKSVSAIVTLAKDTPANDIDAAVNGLQNKYLGCGYYLSIARHLSSAAISAGAPISSGTTSLLTSLPFGARPVQPGLIGNLGRAPPPVGTHRGGFAPPTTYGPSQYGRGPQGARISVVPPSDLKELKLIHMTLEALLAHGPEFEALLMSRRDVQQDERWAWLWDPRSLGGVWYRWRLWEMLSSSRGKGGRRRFRRGNPNDVFEGGAAWMAPEKSLRFEYTTRLEEFVSDSDYNSSEEESADEDNRYNHHHHHQGGGAPESNLGGSDGDARAYLNPLQKTKLTHLLARLPTSNAKLRKGDVARITAFAIEHAGEGGEEVVDMIVSNIQRPFSSTSANPARRRNQDLETTKGEEVDDKDLLKEQEDTSASKLIALYIVSDILSSSSTSGVRHAWRYRQLFETVLKERQVFEGLGQLEKRLHWGRLRAEKWKRSVGSILTLWEGWCVFPQASQDHFVLAFTNPPPTEMEDVAVPANPSLDAVGNAGKSKWKAVELKAQVSESSRPLDLNAVPTLTEEVGSGYDVDGEPMEDADLDGEPMEDLDGEPMEDDLDRQSMDDEGQPMDVEGSPSNDRAMEDEPVMEKKPDQVATNQGDGGSSQRRRPKAEDMFADSDED